VLVKIVPHDAGSIYKVELTHRHLTLAGLSAVLIAVVLLVAHVADVHAAEARLRALQAVEARQRQELSSFSKQTHLLWQRVGTLQRDDEEMHRLTHVIVPKTPRPQPARAKAAARAGSQQYGMSRPIQGVGRANLTALSDSEHRSTTAHGGLGWWAAATLWLHSLVGSDSLGFAAEAAELSSLTSAVDETGRQTKALEARMREVAQEKIARELARERYLAAIPSIWPTMGYVSSGFGYRSYPDSGFHPGLDIVNDYGEPIVATASGVVVEAGWYAGYGYRVIIDHGNGLSTMYAHASRLLVEAGRTVKKGQEIAEIGESGFATGPHVHYQIMLWGRPIDPTPYLSGSVKVVAQM
jgi:murein DD-endopeptidase MepM/ murein hydrolase activator NlpD